MTKGPIRVTTPMLWVIGYAFLIIIGSVATLALVAAKPAYSQHDTYYVVATPHYLLALGVIFAIFAGFYAAFEKMLGVTYDKLLAQIHFWAFFLGVTLIFFPQLFLGLLGMPRRYVDYPEAFAVWNRVSSFGYAVVLASLGPFVLVLVEAVLRRRKTRPS